jgi:DNA/RNA endonuclease YhcR with UshA esterase domain
MRRIAVFTICLLAPLALAADLPEYTFLEAGDHIGEEAIVTGKIVDAYNSGKACFLNFHEDWRNHFSVVIFARNFERFDAPPETLFKGAEVRVRGEIKEFQGRSEIVVDGPDQIEIVSGGGKSEVIDWRNAGDFIGKPVVVEGKIVKSHRAEKLAFLNFAQDHETTLAIIMFERIFDEFPQSPEKYFLHKTVRVTGNIKEHKGRPEIIVTDPARIEILNGGGSEHGSGDDMEAMIRALVDVLVEKGVLTREEFEEKLGEATN